MREQPFPLFCSAKEKGQAVSLSLRSRWELLNRVQEAGPPAVYPSSFLCASSASSSLTRASAASLASCSANLPSRSANLPSRSANLPFRSCSKVGISCPVSGSCQRSSPRSQRTKRPSAAL